MHEYTIFILDRDMRFVSWSSVVEAENTHSALRAAANREHSSLPGFAQDNMFALVVPSNSSRDMRGRKPGVWAAIGWCDDLPAHAEQEYNQALFALSYVNGQIHAAPVSLDTEVF